MTSEQPRDLAKMKSGRISGWAESTIRPLRGTLKRARHMQLFITDVASLATLGGGAILFSAGISTIIDAAGSPLGWVGAFLMAGSTISLGCSRKFSLDAEGRAEWFFLEDGKTVSPAGWDSISPNAELPAGLLNQRDARERHVLMRAQEKAALTAMVDPQ